ncbi:MAG: SDR family NAD(P)-dependent oxidoreductase [Alphaproteobacteria bacterium]|nr:SDR family NAD(P)-dependent oxidoreductase [Alphaproteobacteria bacterium]
MTTPDLSGRIALVTGASRGIGRASAIALAKAGAHVILVARTVGGLEESDDLIREAGGSATLVPMNLRDFDAIDRLGASIYERWGKLDALLGNAGVLGQLTPLAHLEPKTFQEVIDVNLTANWRLIRSLDPLLRLSDAGRVLFVTSGAARKHIAFWGGYALSKSALEILALTYAVECEPTNIKVNLINPGPMRTLMRKKAMPGEDPAYLVKPEEMAFKVVEMLSPSYTLNETIINFQK